MSMVQPPVGPFGSGFLLAVLLCFAAASPWGLPVALSRLQKPDPANRQRLIYCALLCFVTIASIYLHRRLIHALMLGTGTTFADLTKAAKKGETAGILVGAIIITLLARREKA